MGTIARRIALSLAASLALASGAGVNAAQRAVISPPPGWIAEKVHPSKSDVLEQWLSFARGKEEWIDLRRQPNDGVSTADHVKLFHESLQRTGARVYAEHSVSLCGGRTGWYVKHQEFSGDPDTTEDVAESAGRNLYVVSYRYPAMLGPLPAAEKTLRSLCVRANDVVAPKNLPVRFTPPRGWFVSNPAALGSTDPWLLSGYVNPKSRTLAETIWLFAEPADAKAAAAVLSPWEALTAERRAFSSMTPRSLERKVACGIYPAWYLEYDGKFENRKIIADEILVFGHRIYSAVYIRFAETPESPSARGALDTLCPIENP